MFKKKQGKEKTKIQPPAMKPHLTLTLLLEFLKKRKEREKGKQKIFSFLLLVFSHLLFVHYPLLAQVPHLINFQSVVTDATGASLADGMHRIIFRVVDAKGAEGYKETQNLESVHGVVSAMVGSQGELNLTLFDPKVPKFLGVQVEGGGPETLLEIASVPYAMTAEQTLSVAPQSITAESIKPKAITADLLADDVIEKLGGQIVANNISVSDNFIYSRGTTIQTVLKDLDTASYQRQVNMDRFRSDLQTKVDAANSNITSLQSQISAVNASVSANESDTTSRLGTLERSVDQLSTPPKVAAMGIVTWNGSNSSPSLSGGYNAGISDDCHISFSTPIATPYIIQITQVGMGYSQPYYALTISSSGFRVASGVDGGCAITSYHFVVFK